MKALALLIALALAGCAHAPEAKIRTIEVKVPVDDPACARAAVARLGDAPAYPDNAEAIQGAANIFERVQSLLAARELRMAREAALAAALRVCASPPPITPQEPAIH